MQVCNCCFAFVQEYTCVHEHFRLLVYNFCSAFALSLKNSLFRPIPPFGFSVFCLLVIISLVCFPIFGQACFLLSRIAHGRDLGISQCHFAFGRSCESAEPGG